MSSVVSTLNLNSKLLFNSSIPAKLFDNHLAIRKEHKVGFPLVK